MSIKGQIVVILLCFCISFLYMRGFLYGIKRYQLNNSAYKKRKKGERFKEWLLYGRYIDEIPKILLRLYYSVLLIHPVCLVLCVFFHTIKRLDNFCEVFVKILACFDAAWIIIIALLFWSSKPDYAYERWIAKKRGMKRSKK